MEKTAVKERYNLPEHSFWAAFFFFLGIADHPYNKALEKIAEITTGDALKEDLSQLKKDVHTVVKQRRKELPEIKRKVLQNAY